MRTIKFLLKATAMIASLVVSIAIVGCILDFHDKINTTEDPIYGFIAACFMIPLMAYALSTLSNHFINQIKL